MGVEAGVDLRTHQLVEVKQVGEGFHFVVCGDPLVLLVCGIDPRQREVDLLLLVQNVGHLVVLDHKLLGLQA